MGTANMTITVWRPALSRKAVDGYRASVAAVLCWFSVPYHLSRVAPCAQRFIVSIVVDVDLAATSVASEAEGCSVVKMTFLRHTCLQPLA